MNESPYKKAGALSRLLFCWLNGFVKKGDKVEDGDIYKILKDESSTYQCDKLEKMWNEEKGSKHALARSLIRTYGRYLFLWSIVFFLQELFKIIQPVLIGKLIEFYSEGHKDMRQAYIYAGAVCLSIIIPIFILHHYFNATVKVAMKARVACCNLLYRKSLKLNIEQTSPSAVAQLINLMSNDLSRFDIAFSILPFLVIGPLELIVVTCILYFYIGWISVVVSLFVFLFVPFSISLAKLFAYLRRETTKLTDERLSIMTQVINNVKYIRMSCWEGVVVDRVLGVRSKEQNKMLKSGCARGLNLTSSFMSGKIIMLVLIVCLVCSGGVPDAKTVFVAMSIYNPLRFSLTFCFPMALQFGAESIVTVSRIQEFLMSDEKDGGREGKSKSEKDKEKTDENDKLLERKEELQENIHNEKVKIGCGEKGGKPCIIVKDLSLSWKQGGTPFLKNVTFDLEGNDLVMVVGAVGVGKTSLLLSLLGETPQNGDPPITMGTIAYISQEAWLFNASIRDNILMGEEAEEDRYQEVLNWACLLPDLQGMREGDRTMVGDKGVNLSGGQRARVSLARALYRDCDMYLLDDPLSAVDAHVASDLFHSCIKGHLKDKLRLLVTHHTQFLPHATKVLCLRGDQHHVYKPYHLLERGDVEGVVGDGEDDVERMVDDNEGEVDEISGSVEKLVGEDRGSNVERVVTGTTPPKGPSLADVSEVHISNTSLFPLTNQSGTLYEPKEAKPAVTAATYFRYVTAGNGVLVFLLLLLLHAATQAVFLFSDWWLVYWCKAIEDDRLLHRNSTFFNTTTITPNNTTPPFDSSPYFRPFCFICLALLLLAIIRALSTFSLLNKCNKVLHSRMLLAVIKTPMSFFSTNQTGCILDRFSKDLGLTDEMLPFFLFDLMQQTFMVIGVFVMLCVMNYWVIIIITIIVLLFLLLRSYFLKSFKTVKVIEAKNKGPVFSHINTTFLGLTTIRSHGAEVKFRGEFERLQDTHTSSFSLLLSLGRWFALRLELLCVIIICFVTFASVAAADQMDGGRLGLSLTYSITLLWLFQWVVRQSTDVDNLMTHVSRILDYTKLPPEQQHPDQPITFHQSRSSKEIDIEKQTLKANRSKRDEEEELLKDGLGLVEEWPMRGKIEFRDVRLRYKNSGPLVLKNLSFTVAPGQKIGIVGRTGAGKSSLLNVIFKMASFEGSVLIDDVNIDLLPLSVLRSRVSIIPQEQLILKDTVRRNIDAEGVCDDLVLWEVVKKVKLDKLFKDLDYELEGGGANLSCGEQQLLGLSRVLLKRNKILLIDEATARVDHMTDSFIQSALRENFEDMTVLIIAHRINTVIDCDLIMLMEKGSIVEYDTPHNLLNKQGAFYQLAAQAGEGELERFKKIASARQP